MTEPSRPAARVYTIPSGLAFLPALARAVLDEGFPAKRRLKPSLTELARWTILVPTRRTARELSSVFLDMAGHAAAILPRIRPIGDVDEDEQLIAGADETDPAVPPAISPMVRQFLLARLINDWAEANPSTGLARALSGFPGQVFSLARSLGQLVDGFETDEIGLGEIEKLMGADFAEHRLAMLDFLAIVSKRLPEKLSELGIMGRAARRGLLIRREALRLKTQGSGGPIIAAGSTGSIKATVGLLDVVSRLEEGAVVLPGLDLNMDAASWAAVGEEPGHPQFGLKQLLSALNVERSRVDYYPGVALAKSAEARLWLAGEMMRPADTTDGWWESLNRHSHRIRTAMQNVELIEASDQSEEARIIATIMRHSLETPRQKMRLITPSRRLARRVKAELKRWQIDIADQGGEPCAQTPAGAFMRLLLDLGLSRLSAREFAQVLKHPFLRLGAEREISSALAGKVEIALLRGAMEPRGLAGLKAVLAQRLDALAAKDPERQRVHPSLYRLSRADWREIEAFLERFGTIASPFLDMLAGNRSFPLQRFIRAHLECAETMTLDETGKSLLWRGDDGETLSDLFIDLLEHASQAPDLTPADYGALITGELAAHTVRPRTDAHPRLAIMGLLEARLLSTDVVILAGLNHGVWPAEAEIDPWLSRPMKVEVNLASPDRRIGLSAHDFVQNFAAPQVYVTYSRKIDGVPVVPSRWITRLQAVLSAGGVDHRTGFASRWPAMAAALDHRPKLPGAKQPRPAPPVAARPMTLSVTRIEKLISNPYFVYAEKVLELEPLDPLAKRLSAADRGSLVHDALRSFSENCPGKLSDDALDRLLDFGHRIFAPLFYDPQVQAFWWPQFERIAHWFLEQERDWRNSVDCQLCECVGRATLDIDGRDFTLTARADRLDVLSDGRVRIVDYKTGALPTLTAVDEGYAPQLPLEAWLAAQGAFAGCKACNVAELVFVRLSGGQLAGEMRPAGRHNPAALAAASHSGLQQLLRDYASPGTPYVALPADETFSEPGDRHHLARSREWLFGLADGALA